MRMRDKKILKQAGECIVHSILDVAAAQDCDTLGSDCKRVNMWYHIFGSNST
jgi:hypothetical protein